ncbi:MAG TPA: hypothetical protein VK250_08015 [Nitrososphaeraceae archaeon]|nr:hypothetical protein [Nitrososphaeraceae archaeon]
MPKTFANGPTLMISGSCINFNKERIRIIEHINELELISHTKTDYEVSSEGSSLGWDFFRIYFEQNFVERISEIFPEMQKEVGVTLEQRFVIWLSKRFKKRKLDYYLKLEEIPYEKTLGFRLDPENYRNEEDLVDLR